MTPNLHSLSVKKPWQSVLSLQWKRWKSQSLYWLRSLGVDLNDRDIFSRLYIFYILAIVVIWVAVSFSLVLNLAEHLGHRISPQVYPELGMISWILGIVLVIVSSSASPFFLTHDDMQWIASSPLSPRILVLFHFPFRQLKIFLLAALIAAVGAAAVHYHNIAEFALTSGLWITLCQAAGWNISAVHYSRNRKPGRFFWVWVTIALIFLAALCHHCNEDMIQALTPKHLLPSTWTAVLAGLWVLSIFTSARINLVNIHEASTLFADIDKLGTLYLPNRGMVQQLRTQKRFTQKRVHGHLPGWPGFWFHTGRVIITAIRSPRYIWNLVELAFLFRFAMLLLSQGSNRWAWLFWLFVAYRFRGGHMAFTIVEDVSNPFLNQFGPGNIFRRFILSTWLPFSFVFVMSLVFWLFFPLGVLATFPHVLFFTSLILAWVLGEGIAIVRSPVGPQIMNHYHLAAVAASALVMIVGVAMGHVLWSPLIPLGLLGAMLPIHESKTHIFAP